MNTNTSIVTQTVDQTASSHNQLRVAVYLADQNPHRDRSMGITAMTNALVQDFLSRKNLTVHQIVSRSSHRQPQNLLKTCQLPIRTDHAIGRYIVDGFHTWFAKPEVDVWYYPKGYISRVTHSKTPTVATMHDAIVQHYADRYPHTRSKKAFRYWIKQTKASLQRHSCVLTVSENAANQLRKFCERHDINAPNIKVTYEGSLWENFRDHHYEKEDYVIHLASTAEHKQTAALLRTWKELQTSGKDLPELLLVGNLTPEAKSVFETVRGVRLEPTMSTRQLRICVGTARALLLPSEIEGFGLPALEAYYVGTPVCYVNGTSLMEVVCDPQHQGAFKLGDPASFQYALDNVLCLSKNQIRTIADSMYNKFSIKEVADRVIDQMRDCVTRSLFV